MMQLHCLVLFALCYGALAMPRPENNGGVSSTDEDPPEEYLKMAIKKAPICGVPDVAEYSAVPKEKNTWLWDKTVLTYSILNYTKDLPDKDVDEAIKSAFNLWSQVTPLNFTKVNSDIPADIQIKFVTLEHGDGNAFTGSDQAAHAFYPVDQRRGRVHFNDDKKWTRDLSGTNLFLVATHEFGHTLGLYHSNRLPSVMSKYYRHEEPDKFHLSEDDIKGIQSLYGARPKDGARNK